MISLKNSLFSLGLAAFVATAACEHEQKQPAPTPAQQAEMQLQSERTSYVNQVQNRINQLTSFSESLRSKSATAPKPQDKKLSNAADDLESLLGDVKKSLKEVKTASSQNWLDYKRDVEKSMDRAETLYNNSIPLIQ